MRIEKQQAVTLKLKVDAFKTKGGSALGRAKRPPDQTAETRLAILSSG